MPITKRSLIEEVVAALEVESLCVDCLARQVAHRRHDVAGALNDLRRAFRLSSQAACCPRCGAVRMTYKVADAPFAMGG